MKKTQSCCTPARIEGNQTVKKGASNESTGIVEASHAARFEGMIRVETSSFFMGYEGAEAILADSYQSTASVTRSLRCVL